jgi:hypothetical protein
MDDDYNEVDLTGTLTLALASGFSAAYAESTTRGDRSER